MATTSRLTNTGTLLVNGSFDENTLQPGSALFDGSTNYLSTPANDAAYVAGANNFTIEAWVYPTTTSVELGISNTWQGGGAWVWKILSNNTLQFFFTNAASGSSTFTTTSSGTITANAWTYLATVRNNNTITHYINGIADASTGNATGQIMYEYNGAAKPFRLGTSADLGSKFKGYISNFRFVNGSAVYTSNFTPPNIPLTAVANTTALFNTSYNLANVYTFVDSSSTNAAVTNNGNVSSTQVIPPLPVFSTTANTVYAGTLDEVTLTSGAAVFNGTSQSLSVASNAVFAVGTGDFTVECWVYPRASTSQAIFDLRTPDNVGAGFDLYISPTGPSFRVGTSGTNYLASIFSGLNRWYHLAVSRSGSTFSLYVNGTLGQTVTNTSNFTNSTPRVGTGVNGFFNGYISNFRMIKGTGLYTANFTPPQTVLPAVTGTSLLLNTLTSTNFTTDTSPNTFTVTNNGATTFTTVNPYTNGSTTVKQRQLKDGTLEVYTEFDENTGIV
jgi:hypothetical protein